MVTHIAHATATFAELSLAMSIAMLTKIIMPPPIIDSLARETTAKRLEAEENWFVKLFYQFACTISDKIRGFFSNAPVYSFLLALASLFGLALCPISNTLVDWSVFAVSFFSFLLRTYP